MAKNDIIRIGLAQIDSTVGDFEGNYHKIIEYTGKAKNEGCDIVVFPELAVCGYPPEDLIYKSGFLSANTKYLEKTAKKTDGIVSVVGFVHSAGEIYNAAAVLCNKKTQGIYHKTFLPNYGVFDEERYFQKGSTPLFFSINDKVSCGISICEDIWYPEGPGFSSALSGAEIIININASPFHHQKWALREKMLSERANDYLTAIVYCNLVGGQDEIVFDGHSIVVDEKGKVAARGKSFAEELIVTDINLTAIRTKRQCDPRWKKRETLRPISKPQKISLDLKISAPKTLVKPVCPPPPSLEEEVFLALKTGLKDYFYKNNFKKGVIGLSGGIDSSLVAAVAVEALGKENVAGVSMPSMFTSKESKDDAAKLAKNLGIKLHEVRISNIYKSYLKELKPVFKNLPFDTTEENLQARIRGNILMAFSNKFGWLVITTGNKSEMSTGYATLYGDMAGGFALLKDVPKTLVYAVSEYYNALKGRTIIPKRVFTKAPTAELRLNQTDQDTLPPYEMLDRIIKAYVEDNHSKQEIIDMGIDEATVSKTIKMIDNNEYKRRQAPPGVKITPRAFGKDRRMPITNRFKE